MAKSVPSTTSPPHPAVHAAAASPKTARTAPAGAFAALFARPEAGARPPRDPFAREAGLGATRGETRPAETLARARRDDDHDASDHREQGPRRLDATLDADVLAPFTPPPTVLSAPPAPSSELRHSSDQRLDAAALAERLVRSMRVGKVGGGHEVRLRLGAAAGHGDVEVRLRHEAGELRATLIAHDGGPGAGQLAERLAHELSARGLGALAIDVEAG